MSEIKAQPDGTGRSSSVVGVGGAGGNAVNHMWNLGIRGVKFMVCNTDQQALDKSPVELKIRLGSEGSRRQRSRKRTPCGGRDAARDPAAARAGRHAHDFHHGGHGRRHRNGRLARHREARQGDGAADRGHRHLAAGRRGEDPLRTGATRHRGAAAECRFAADITTKNILEIYGRLSLKQAFGKADDILASAAKGIAEIITVESDLVNVDFADVSKVMRDSGRAHMAVATAEGDNRAEAVAEASLRSPLLDHNLISGAKNILLNISVSNAEELMYEEVVRILEYIQMHASVQDEHGTIHNANIIWGTSEKPQLGNAIELVVVATGFEGEEGEELLPQPAATIRPVEASREKTAAPVLEPVKPAAQQPRPAPRPLEQVVLGAKSTRYSDIEQRLAKPPTRPATRSSSCRCPAAAGRCCATSRRHRRSAPERAVRFSTNPTSRLWIRPCPG